MGNPEILTVILAVIAATGASLATGLLTRPKMSAEAKAATAGGEVALSTDARAWAETFRQETAKAVIKAQAAEVRADQAEEEARALAVRVSELERRMNAVVAYVFTLQGQVRQAGQTPVEPPADLRPPL